MPPTWLVVLSWAALAVAFASAAWILADVYGRGYRQPMKIMEVVWPVTALYFGPVAVAAYRAWGRPKTRRWRDAHGDPPDKPGYATTAVGVSHCGAGCTLGDIIAEFSVFALGAHRRRRGPVRGVHRRLCGSDPAGRRVPVLRDRADAGFFTAWPANVWLIRRGIKEAM